MRWLPKNPGWWIKAVAKAGGYRAMPAQPSETEQEIARLHVARALARTEAEKARMQTRVKVLMQKGKTTK